MPWGRNCEDGVGPGYGGGGGGSSMFVSLMNDLRSPPNLLREVVLVEGVRAGATAAMGNILSHHYHHIFPN